MSKKKSKQNNRAAAKITKDYAKSWFCGPDAFNVLCSDGYTRLSDCPEVIMAVNYIANLISSMTIYLMKNGEDGDERVKNALSKKIDINPNPPTTRKTWLYTIVRTMLLEGKGNSVVLPLYNNRNDLIERLIPLPPPEVVFAEINTLGYKIVWKNEIYDPSEMLHFVWNPRPDTPYIGQGVTVALKNVANALKQTETTKNGFMSSKWKPSIIVAVDADSEQFSSKEGRIKILSEYVENDEAGAPWVIPSEFIKVESVKPLSLQDLAISDTIKLDKLTVAGLLGVPPFVVGAGPYKKQEFNNFVGTFVMSICRAIEQELTAKLIYSEDWYFWLNLRSLYAYDLPELVTAGVRLIRVMGARRNEVRSWIGLPPDPEMKELLGLENYLPVDRLGDQKKLIQDKSEEQEEDDGGEDIE